MQPWPHLAQALAAQSRTLALTTPAELAATLPPHGPEAATIILRAPATPEAPLDATLTHIAATLAALAATPCRLWIVVRGLRSAPIDPQAEAVWSFARVAINEYPGLDLRLLDLAPDLPEAEAAARLAALIADPGPDTELLADATGTAALRMHPATLPDATPPDAALRLHVTGQGPSARFDWRPAPRRAPGPGEIEIAIAACGLNFRDVMLASGLLDDDVLDTGLAGATFGFECAGTVLQAGQGVTALQPGDAVMGFGRGFATHATADARVFTRAPEGAAATASATIPVAFLTAWYGLVHMAQLQPGEWVLIHGAAGGVGLAAIQIARLRGARIAATVSTPEKRALVAAAGAERIYNSRSTAFADAIRAEIGGVDVVLNSLAGDAMQASLKCLNPFGRFIELGKRDYVLNTTLGLRPFRRNLSYFGVDLDQLLAANLPLAARLMAELATHFTTGALVPLPHRVLGAREVARACQLMQSAGHVGKLVIEPPAAPATPPAAPPPSSAFLPSPSFLPSQGVHLVVGGNGGFGFETVAWLAAQGAATIVAASRRGQFEPHCQPRAEAIRAAGTTLLAETLDVTDAAATTALLARLAATHGRIAGIIHAAAVLDDALIANLTPARLRAVLAPKTEGAANLDAASRTAPLDYFAAFSSLATLAGNPGQAAYAAANGYLQGLMARRRAQGLPGLAIGWGPIADAGLLTRDPAAAARLAQLTGAAPMPAEAALSHLAAMLAAQAGAPATLYCARLGAGQAAVRLKLLGTPTFAALAAAAGAATPQDLDLAARIAGKSEGEARTLVAALVAAEVGRIFRLPPEEVERARPLDELGLDSMMSLDLRMSIEKRFGIELPVVAITAGVSVNDLAGRLIAALRSGPAPAEDDAALLAMQQHGIDSAAFAAASQPGPAPEPAEVLP